MQRFTFMAQIEGGCFVAEYSADSVYIAESALHNEYYGATILFVLTMENGLPVVKVW